MEARATTVDEYLKNLPQNVRVLLENVRAIIKNTAPEAFESISYQIPAYHYHGPLIFFAAFKKHCGLYAVSKKILEELEEELRDFKVKGNTIQFTVEKPISNQTLRRIVELRMKENEEYDKKGK